MSTYYDDYRNSYYNPDDVEEQPGDNQNWKMIQKGFKDLEDTIIKDLTINWFNSSSITVEAGKSYQFSILLTDAQLETLGHNKITFSPQIIIMSDPATVLMSQAVFALKRNNDNLYAANRINLTDVMSEHRIIITLFNPGTADITLAAASLVVSVNFFKDFL